MLANFNLRILQTFLALLNAFVSQGYTDIRAVQESVQREIERRAKRPRKMSIQARREARKRKRERQGDFDPSLAVDKRVCPECGSKQWYPVRREGIEYVGCRDCRFSQLIGEK